MDELNMPEAGEGVSEDVEIRRLFPIAQFHKFPDDSICSVYDILKFFQVSTQSKTFLRTDENR
jgi:hypothetical protein